MKKTTTLFLRLLLPFLLLFMSMQIFAADKSIVLGQSAALSGPSGQFGRQMWLGAQTYFDEVNHHGGVKGRKIRVEALDDKYDVELSKKNTAELLKDSNLFALFGYVGTPTLLSALPELVSARNEGSHVFLFSNRTGAKQQRTSPYDTMVYNIRASYGEETEALVNHLVEKGAKKVGLFLQDDSYGQSGKDGVSAALTQRGLSVVTESKYKRGTLVSESMKAQADNLISNKVDAIISIASYEAAAAFVRDVRDSGFSGPIANISFVGSSDMLLLLKSEGEKYKKNYTDSLIVSQVVPPVTAKDIPIVAEYVRLSEKSSVKIPDSISNHQTIRKVSFTGLEGFINAKVFVEILKKIKGPITQDSFVQAADNGFTLDLGLKSPIKFSKENHQALHDVYLTKVVDGSFVLIKE